MTAGLAALLGLALWVAPGCGDSAPEGPQRGTGVGVVQRVDAERQQVVIDHEDIPGLMKAMTMGFDVATPELLEGLEAGRAVEFDVEYQGGRYRVTDLRPR